MSDSDSDSERDWIEQKVREYIEGIRLFLSREASGENAALLKTAQKMSLPERAQLACTFYEMRVMYKVGSRPRFEFTTIGEENLGELEVFCRLFRFGWELFPDAWVGMCMLVEYIAEKFESSDIARLDTETLETIKQIAVKDSWPANPIAGRCMSTGAKTILARHSRGASFEDSTTNLFVRQMAFFQRLSDMHAKQVCPDYEAIARDALPAVMGAMSLSPTQPERKNLDRMGFKDMRRVCSSPFCTEVELVAKFPKCSVCKKVSYCSKRCQVTDWKAHKKHCCP